MNSSRILGVVGAALLVVGTLLPAYWDSSGGRGGHAYARHLHSLFEPNANAGAGVLFVLLGAALLVLTLAKASAGWQLLLGLVAFLVASIVMASVPDYMEGCAWGVGVLLAGASLTIASAIWLLATRNKLTSRHVGRDSPAED